MATVAARMLLGWMPEDEAMRFLNKCEMNPPLTDAQKKELWQSYVDKTNAIQREYAEPNLKKVTLREQIEVRKFLKAKRAGPGGDHLVKVLKLDPSNLIIHQFFVITERCEAHGKQMLDDRTRIDRCLGNGLDERHMITDHTDANGTTIVKLPHFEFAVLPKPGYFEIAERARYIAVIRANGKLVLWSGYHRSYALSLSQMTPDGDGAAALVTLNTDVDEVRAFLGAASERPAVRDAVLGAKPPIFSDFLNAELFMDVQLLRERLEVHIAQPTPGRLEAKPVWVPE